MTKFDNLSFVIVQSEEFFHKCEDINYENLYFNVYNKESIFQSSTFENN